MRRGPGLYNGRYMSKRLHDSDEWGRQWFRRLSTDQKLLWLYIWDHCDCAGTWEIDFETFEFRTGIKFDDSVLSVFSDRCRVIGDYLFVFAMAVEYWGYLQPTHKMYKPVSAALAKIGLTVEKLQKKPDKINEIEVVI